MTRGVEGAFVSWSMVIYGPFILLFKRLGFWVVVLVALIIGAAWVVYDVFIKKQ